MALTLIQKPMILPRFIKFLPFASLCASFLRMTFTASQVITFAPQGTSIYPQEKDTLQQLSQYVDFYHIQFYNYGQWYDQQGTQFHQTNEVGSATLLKNILPPEKIVIGLPLYTLSGTSNQQLLFMLDVSTIIGQSKTRVFFWQLYKQGADAPLSQYVESIKNNVPYPLIQKKLSTNLPLQDPPPSPNPLPPLLIEFSSHCRLRFQLQECYETVQQLQSSIVSKPLLSCSLIIQSYVKFLCFYYKLNQDISKSDPQYLMKKYYNFQSAVSIYGGIKQEVTRRFQDQIIQLVNLHKTNPPTVEVLFNFFEAQELYSLESSDYLLLAQAVIFLSQIPNEAKKFLQFSPTGHMLNSYGQLNFDNIFDESKILLPIITPQKILDYKFVMLQIGQVKTIHPNFSFYSMFSNYFKELINKESQDVHQKFTNRILDKLDQRSFYIPLHFQFTEELGRFYEFNNIRERPVDDLTESFYFQLYIKQIQPQLFQYSYNYIPPTRTQEQEDKLEFQSYFQKFYNQVVQYLKEYKG